MNTSTIIHFIIFQQPSTKEDLFDTKNNDEPDSGNSSILSEVCNSDVKYATLGRKSSDLLRYANKKSLFTFR